MDRVAPWVGISLIFVAVMGINYLILYLFKWAKGRQLLLYSFLVSVAWVISNVANVYLLALTEKIKIGGIPGLVFVLSIGISVSTIFVAATLALLKSLAKISGSIIRILLTSILITILSLSITVAGVPVTWIVIDKLTPELDESGE